MKKIVIVLLVLFSQYQILGQEIEDGTVVSKGKIYTMDSEVIDGQYIVFSDDSLEYYLSNSEQRHVMSLDEVKEVSKYGGHYGNTGMWVGTIGGAIIGVVVALGTEETETSGFVQTTTIQTWPIYVFTLVGGLAGMLIGQSAEDWETVYSNKISFLENININSNQFGTHISYRIHF